MSRLTENELCEAARAIASTRMKSEKAILKLKDGSAQQRNIARGIAAYSLALQLIARELGEPNEPIAHDKESLDQAIEVFASMTTRVEAILPKFAAGTPQHTLAVRRLRAFEIAVALIGNERQSNPC